jgi:hypothetical protein
MYQTNTALITSALVEELHAKSAIPKPTALGTKFRYSSAFGCGRQQGYAALGFEPTDPMDESGAWATGLGTIVHEALQDALSRKFLSARFEVPSQFGGVSGSCDALIATSEIGDLEGTHVLYELKTMGTYSFDKQVGWNRMRSTTTTPEGPALKAIAQAGMNALGIMKDNPDVKIEWLVMGSVTFEALSKNKASTMGVEGTNRFLAEFYIAREEWEPIAFDEKDRMGLLEWTLLQGQLPGRIAIDDDGTPVSLNPNGKNWQCDYCAYRTACLQDGADLMISESVLTTNKEAE